MGWDFKRADWKLFRKVLDEKVAVEPIGKGRSSIERSAELLTIAIQAASKAAVPLKQTGLKAKAQNSEALQALKNERNKARKLWQRTRMQHHYQAYMNSSEAVQNEWNRLADVDWGKVINSDKDNKQAFWRISKALRRGAREQLPPLTTANKGLAVTAEEKCEALADMVVVPLPYNNPVFIEGVENHISQTLSDEPSACPARALTSPAKLEKIIKNLRLNKAPGADGITARFLRNLSRKALAFTASLFNACTSQQIIPSSWKFSKVITIYKPGKDKRDPCSYRPISL